MTIQDVIERVTKARNERGCSTDFIIEKINEIEWRIKRELTDTHEGAEAISFDGYDSTELNVQLIAPEPYSGLYVKWVLYQVDLMNNAMVDASNSLTLFNRDYYSFTNWYIRNHLPLYGGNVKSGVFHV